MDYLEDAAVELAAAREDNEKRLEDAADMIAIKRPLEAAKILAEVNIRRLELAAAFTRLAAINAGLPPCCHAPRPGQETS